MNLSDLIAQERKPRLCKVGSAIPKLSKADQKALQEALDTDAITIPATTIARALEKMGFAIHVDQIRNHRVGSCRCVKP